MVGPKKPQELRHNVCGVGMWVPSSVSFGKPVSTTEEQGFDVRGKACGYRTVEQEFDVRGEACRYHSWARV